VPDGSESAQDRLGVLIGNLALRRGFITPQQLRDALADQARQAASGRDPGLLGEVLVARSLITPAQLEELLAEQETQTGVPRPAAGAPRRARPSPRPGDEPSSLGKYLLTRSLGRGAVGAVFAAIDTSLDRKVALKLLLSSLDPAAGTDAREEKRFIKEAQLAANIPRHPHIVSVYEAGELEGKRFIAMELASGRQMDAWRKSSPAPALRLQVRVLRDVALAVHHAHEEGVIHRDLKPQNILVDERNEPHVTDFGLALERRVEDRSAVSAVGAVMGTPAYMSPEQAQGRTDLDRRTDIYALGVMLYEALSGRVPFRGRTPIETIMMTANDPVPPPSQAAGAAVDPALEAICLRALAKDARRRIPTARKLADDLSRWLKGPTTIRASAPVRRKPLLLASAGAGALLLAALLALAWPRRDPNAADLAAAEAMLRQGNHDRALVLYELVAARDPACEPARVGRAAALARRREALQGDLDLAARLVRQGRYPEAHKLFTTILAVDPSNAAAAAGQRDAQARLLQEAETARKAARDAVTEADRRAAEEKAAALDSARAEVARSAPEIPPSSPAGAAPSVQFSMGDPAGMVGLRILSAPDGPWQAVVLEGKPCIRVLPNSSGVFRLYFDVDPSWTAQPAVVQFEIDYLDSASAEALELQYDSTDLADEYQGAYARIPPQTRQGTGGWKTWRGWMPCPNLRSRQSGGADFRLQGRDLVIHRVRLSPAGPTSPRIAATADAPRTTAPGLAGMTHSGTAFDVPKSARVDAGIRFQWADKTGPDGMTGNFSIRWTGWFKAPRTGRYVFRTLSDDGVRLAVGGTNLISNWTNHQPQVDFVLCDLEEGLHPIQLDYYQGAGPGTIDLACFAESDARMQRLDPAPFLHDAKTAASPPPAARVCSELPSLSGHRNGVTCVAFSPDGRRLLSGSYVGEVHLWDLAAETPRPVALGAHSGTVRSVAFSPDGRTAASGGIDGRILLSDLSVPGSSREFRKPGGHAISLVFSPDGSMLAAGNVNWEARLWEVANGREARVFHGLKGGTAALGISRDGKTLAAGIRDRGVLLWELGSATEPKPLVGCSAAVESAALAPDGRRAAAGCADGNLFLWDVGGSAEPRRIRAHASEIKGLAFSGDGTLLASASLDKSVKVWDPASGAARTDFAGYNHRFLGVAFSPDGRRLAAAAEDWSVKLWDVSSLAPAPAAPAAEAARPRLWTLLVENRRKLAGQPVSLQRSNLPGARFALKDVSSEELVLDAALAAGGSAEIREKAEDVKVGLVAELLDRAGVLAGPKARLLSAQALAEGGEFDPAFRELDRAKAAGADAAAVGAALATDEWAVIDRATPEKDRKREHERFLRKRAAWVTDDHKRALEAPRTSAAPKSAEIDLLALVDPVRDAVAGSWRREASSLLTAEAPTQGRIAELRIPSTPPPEYDLVLVAERMATPPANRHRGMDLGLVSGGRQASLVLDGDTSGTGCGLQAIDGKGMTENGTAFKGPVFREGSASTIVCSVRKGGIAVTVDGRTVVRWEGDSQKLSRPSLFTIPERGVLFLGTWTTYRITRLALTARESEEPALAAGWTSLFDGTGLRGWETIQGQPRVENGAIVLEAAAEVMTRIEGPDFELAGSLQLAESVPQLCGSIGFRRPGRSRARPTIAFFMDGDVHVIDQATEPAWRVGARTVRPREWQSFTLRVQGDRAELDLEGRTVYSRPTTSREAGFLALYSNSREGGRILFRDVRVRPLSSTASDTGLVGWWKLDEASGTMAADSSGRGHAGMLKGGAAWTPGRLGNALRLDGTSGCVEIPNSPLMENVQEGDYTLSAWYHPIRVPAGRNPSDNDSTHGVLLKQGRHLGLMYGNEGHFRLEHWAGTDQTYVGAPRPCPPGAWYHVAGVVSPKGGSAAIYVNGALENRKSFAAGSATFELGTAPWRIGAGNPAAGQWRYHAEGVVDDVRIYARALDEAEVRALANPAARR
jgi:tetratricopeptide (TPR) repeat protein